MAPPPAAPQRTARYNVNKLMLRSGPLNGITVEPRAKSGVVVVAYQTISGRRTIVQSPWSTVKGRTPISGLEIELVTYSRAGAFEHDGTDTACET